MYSRTEVSKGSQSGWTAFIHPVQAMLLAMFTDRRPFRAHCEDIAAYFRLSQQQAEEMMSPYIMNGDSFYTEFQGNKVFFPKNVLVPLDEGKELPIYNIDFGDLSYDAVDLTYERVKKGPLSALFMLNNRCLTDCRYCYADKKTRCSELSTQQIFEIIDEAAELKMQNIDVIGGELFYKKDWNLILERLVQKNLSPSFISTKVPMTKVMVDKLKHTGYNKYVQISLDSMSEDTLKRLVRCPNGYLKSLLDGIRLLEDAGFKLRFDTVLTNANSSEAELYRLYDYIKSVKGLDIWEIRIPEVTLYRYDDFKTVVYDKEDLADACRIARKIQSQADIAINVNDRALNPKYRCVEPDGESCFSHGNCGILRDKLFILPDGKVGVCEQLYWNEAYLIGDLTKNSIEEIWKSERANEVFNMKYGTDASSRCHDCAVLDVCNKKRRRCPVQTVKAYGYTNMDYPDPECSRAPENIRSVYWKSL